MARFSERFGFNPVRSALQIDAIDDGLRNQLWNLIGMRLFSALPSSEGHTGNYLPILPANETFKILSHYYFKKPIDQIGTSYLGAVRRLRDYFFSCQWYEVYDLVEFLPKLLDGQAKQDFVDELNESLKEEMSGYRLVSGLISPITDEQQILAIEQALTSPDSLKPTREHLRQALKHLADRANPDYRNSIKESVLAVEALCKIISGLPSATLAWIIHDFASEKRKGALKD
jgi:hypothetical protein